MGYYLQAFVARKEDLNTLKQSYSQAKLIELKQGLGMIPLTDALFDQINNNTASEGIDSFEYLTVHIESEVLKRINEKAVAYIEAEYWGGDGGQIGIIWKDGQRHLQLPFAQEVINQVLRFFGAVAKAGEDEFDTLDLGRYRNTREWVEDEE